MATVYAGEHRADGIGRKWFDSVDRDLGGRDAAQGGCGHGHIGGQRLRRYRLSEQFPLLVDTAVGWEGRLSQNCVEGLSLLDAHGRSPSCVCIDW
jgi:hypothetical protein